MFHHPLKNIAVLLLAKGIIDVFTFICCFSYYFKARWPNHRSCHIMIVRQLRPDCPSSPSSVLIFPFCIYTAAFTASSLGLIIPCPSLLLSHSCFLMLLLEQVPSCVAEGTKLSLCFSPAPIQQRKQQKSNKDSQKSKRSQFLALVHRDVLRIILFTCSSSS